MFLFFFYVGLLCCIELLRIGGIIEKEKEKKTHTQPLFGPRSIIKDIVIKAVKTPRLVSIGFN
jgi:hypothetical protein